MGLEAIYKLLLEMEQMLSGSAHVEGVMGSLAKRLDVICAGHDTRFRCAPRQRKQRYILRGSQCPLSELPPGRHLSSDRPSHRNWQRRRRGRDCECPPPRSATACILFILEMRHGVNCAIGFKDFGCRFADFKSFLCFLESCSCTTKYTELATARPKQYLCMRHDLCVRARVRVCVGACVFGSNESCCCTRSTLPVACVNCCWGWCFIDHLLQLEATSCIS